MWTFTFTKSIETGQYKVRLIRAESVWNDFKNNMEHKAFIGGGILLLIILVIGFLFPYLHTYNYAMPDIPTTPPHCPILCELNNTYEDCQIPECNYLKCPVKWYWFCWWDGTIPTSSMAETHVNYPALKGRACNYVTDTLQLAG